MPKTPTKALSSWCSYSMKCLLILRRWVDWRDIERDDYFKFSSRLSTVSICQLSIASSIPPLTYPLVSLILPFYGTQGRHYVVGETRIFFLHFRLGFNLFLSFNLSIAPSIPLFTYPPISLILLFYGTQGRYWVEAKCNPSLSFNLPITSPNPPFSYPPVSSFLHLSTPPQRPDMK